ncbi:alpha/beta fold hydrolase [Nocardiopsis metallicus]|uniref:alpha/beta fold hydrolase n=1 Tax=Nocardiopsis metallicus TaxID=179819 RepID=UPI0035E40FB7
MLPVEDTALAVHDTGGSGTPVVYLNGSYAGKRHWRPVIRALGPGWRHITFDERARGRSKRSADYSFEATIRDLDAVLEARKVERPILVGWSYGALIGAHWANRCPDRVTGVVGVDGPFPCGWTDEASHDRIRRQYPPVPVGTAGGPPRRQRGADERPAARRDQHRGAPAARGPGAPSRRPDRPAPVRGRLRGGIGERE